MASKQRHQPCLDEIERLGGTIDRVRTGKHVVVYWQFLGHKLMTVCPISPSDHRAVLNKLAELRRQVRALTEAA